jgi:hypothetical protein
MTRVDMVGRLSIAVETELRERRCRYERGRPGEQLPATQPRFRHA